MSRIIRVQQACNFNLKGYRMMEDTNATGKYYCIGHIVQFTGLTDRTIRSYLAS